MKTVIFSAFMMALAACAPAKQEATTTQSETSATVSTTTTSATATTATSATTTTVATNTTTQSTTANPTEVVKEPKAKESKSMSNNSKVAELHTTAGEIDIRFFPDVAPNHVKNFISLAEKGFYNGTKFHRVIPGFMIQGGDPNTISGDPSTWGTGGSDKKVGAEFNSVKHKRGIVSMARSMDPDSASSQFFIMVADYPSLDGKYSAFGEVTKGMDVADKIVGGATGANDRPLKPVAIESIKIRDAREDEKGPTPK